MNGGGTASPLEPVFFSSLCKKKSVNIYSAQHGESVTVSEHVFSLVHCQEKEKLRGTRGYDLGVFSKIQKNI